MTRVLGRKTILIGGACLLVVGAAAGAVTQHAAVADPPPSVSVTPQAMEVSPGDSFQVDVVVDAAGRDLLIFDVAVQYDSGVLNITAGNIQYTNPLDTANCTGPDCGVGELATTGVTETDGVGMARYGAARVPDPVAGVDEAIMEIEFAVDGAASAGQHAIQVTIAGLANAEGMFPDTVTNDCVVNIVTEAFDPWDYDSDGDAVIGKTEMVVAVSDYFEGLITKGQVVEIATLYFDA